MRSRTGQVRSGAVRRPEPAGSVERQVQVRGLALAVLVAAVGLDPDRPALARLEPERDPVRRGRRASSSTTRPAADARLVERDPRVLRASAPGVTIVTVIFWPRPGVVSLTTHRNASATTATRWTATCVPSVTLTRELYVPRGTNAPPSVRPSHAFAWRAGVHRLVGDERPHDVAVRCRRPSRSPSPATGAASRTSSSSASPSPSCGKNTVREDVDEAERGVEVHRSGSARR